MIRKLLYSSALGIVLGLGSACAAEVFVQVAPPRPIVEARVAAPGPGYVWIGGYHRWNGTAYGWVPGRWELPPRPRAVWVPHRWVRRHGGWVFVEGRWR
jgi:WXXGXW repeat (2 copies)